MQAPVEICYAGVVIARSEEVREGKGGDLFVVLKDPLPVGTLVDLRSADTLVSMRVVYVLEAPDGANSGMQVRPAGSDDGEAAIWIPPPPAAKPVGAPAATATPAIPAAEPASASRAEDPAPADESMKEAVGREAPVAAKPVSEPTPTPAQAVDAAFVGKEEPPVSVEVVVTEPAMNATESAAVPVVVGPSANNPTEEATGREPEAASGAVNTTDDSSASGNVVPPLEGDLPPARPVQNGGGRRRTKRRR